LRPTSTLLRLASTGQIRSTAAVRITLSHSGLNCGGLGTRNAIDALLFAAASLGDCSPPRPDVTFALTRSTRASPRLRRYVFRMQPPNTIQFKPIEPRRSQIHLLIGFIVSRSRGAGNKIWQISFLRGTKITQENPDAAGNVSGPGWSRSSPQAGSCRDSA